MCPLLLASFLNVALFLLCGTGAPVISFTNGLGLYVLRVLTAFGLFMVGLLFKYLILTVTL